MNPRGKFYEKDGRKLFVTTAICDFLQKDTFMRLYEANQYARENGAELYVGVYSDELMEKVGKNRNFKSIVSNQDRINLVEALRFVDGAFLINDIGKNQIEQALDSKLIRQKDEKEKRQQEENFDKKAKKYSIGYASGAFSNLHKGHLEHLKEMDSQCDKVIVAANSDDLIKEYKKKDPSVDEKTRRLILANIKYVDLAIITNDYDKVKAVEKVKELCGEQFDAIFVGSDWKGSDNWKNFEEKLKQYGIEIVFTDRPENGISTTKIDKARKNKKNKKAPEIEER